MPDVPVKLPASLGAAQSALAAAQAEFKTRKDEWVAYEAAYTQLIGASQAGGDLITMLLKTYGPKIATYFGLPVGAMGLTALTADPGAFGMLRGVLGKVLGLFGFGG